MILGPGPILRLIREKLGVCPFCMRTSAAGSLVFGLGYALSGVVLREHVFSTLLLLAAAAFALLFLAHLTAYMTRAVYRLRHAQHQALADPGGSARIIGRREFVTRVLQAGGYALMISLFGTTRVFARPLVDTCSGKHGSLFKFIEGLGATEAAARAHYAAMAIVECDLYCGQQTCDGGLGCLQAGTPVPTEPRCRLDGQLWSCTGDVKQCSCGCNRCQGSHRPPTTGDGGLDDPGAGSGVGGNQGAARADAERDAREKCDQFCDQFKDCTLPERCKRNSDPQLGKMKTWRVDHENYGASVPIEKCRCRCQ